MNVSLVTQQNLAAADVTVTLQTSSDLQTWTNADTILQLTNDENFGNGIARYSWSLQETADPGKKLFVRLRVEER